MAIPVEPLLDRSIDPRNRRAQELRPHRSELLELDLDILQLAALF